MPSIMRPLERCLACTPFFPLGWSPKQSASVQGMVPFLPTLPKTNIAPENRPSQRTLVFQPSICRCYVSFRECRWFEEINKLKCDLKCLGWIKKTCLCCRFVPYTFSETKPQMVPKDLQCQIYNPVTWVVVSNIFCSSLFGEWSKLTSIFFRLVETTNWLLFLIRRCSRAYGLSTINASLLQWHLWYSIIGACFGLCRMLINCNESHFQLARFLVQNRLTLQNRSKIDLACV